MVQELNKETFTAKVLKGKGPIIVDFWASWCGPCRMMAPVFEELSKEMQGKLEFAKVSTEDFPEIAGDQSVQGIPCLIVYKGGKEIDRIVGFAPKAILQQKIDAVLQKK